MQNNTPQDQRIIERDKSFIFDQLKSGKTLSQVARQSGYSENAIRSWLNVSGHSGEPAYGMNSVF